MLSPANRRGENQADKYRDVIEAGKQRRAVSGNKRLEARQKWQSHLPQGSTAATGGYEERLPGQRPGGVQQTPGFMHSTESSRFRSPPKGRRCPDPLYGESPDHTWRASLHTGIDTNGYDPSCGKIQNSGGGGDVLGGKMVITIESVVATPIGFGLKFRDGAVVVHHVVEDSNAEMAGILAGDVILQADSRGEEPYETLMHYLSSREEDSEVVLVLDREVEDLESAVADNSHHADEWETNKALKAALEDKDKELAEMALRNDVARAEIEMMRQACVVEGEDNSGGKRNVEISQVYTSRLEQVTAELEAAKQQLVELKEQSEAEDVCELSKSKPLAISSQRNYKSSRNDGGSKQAQEDVNNKSKLWREQITKENKLSSTPRKCATPLSYPYPLDQ
eukprot:TRINITY_DN15013_c0_g8_i1.p1 TRINITY_DN15013_c0_g8~~TRINITY_DN15013_c0_g8_i1.p1  ORF type:complete len:394 (+),score=115.88 TRINITY_DN15013_c0_g8_i1:120-1301(+)